MKAFCLLVITSLLIGFNPVFGQYCGNNNQEGPDPPPPQCTPSGVNIFDSYTGNVHREIKDLEIWGSVGEIPMVWMRYGNSRSGDFTDDYGKAHYWNHSFKYDMSNVKNSSPAAILIHYPEGGENTFVQDISDPTVWLPSPGVKKRLFQDGNDYYLQMEDGSRYHFQYLGTGSNKYYQLQDIKDSQQNDYILTYDDNKRLIQVTEPAGRYFKISYTTINGIKVIHQVSTNDNRSVTYNYDVYNDGITVWVRLINVQYGDLTQATYTYSETPLGTRPRIEHAVDPRNEGPAVNMKYTYSLSIEGQIEEEINGSDDSVPGAGVVMASYNSSTFNRTVCYPNGRKQIYSLPSAQMGQLKTYTNGLQEVGSFTYIAGGIGFCASEKDAQGRVMNYNNRTIYGTPTKVTYPDKNTESWERDDLDLVLKDTDQLGRVTIYTRDTSHRVLRIDYPDLTSEAFTYNNFGEVLTHTRKNGKIESYTYDNRGLKTSFTDALGDATAYTYDNADRLASVTDAEGHKTSYNYNERGLLVQITYADQTSKSYTYDDFGDQTSIIDELGHSWATKYDEFKRPVTKTDPLNRVTTYSYDLPDGICGCSHEKNKPTKITLPSGRVNTTTYDVEWRRLSKTIGAGSPDEATAYYEYDNVGNIKTIIDPREDSIGYVYDSLNRKISSTDAVGHKMQWRYDAAGNVTEVIRADGGTTDNLYDNMNRLIQTTDPKLEITKFKYDAEGNLTGLTDAKNHAYNLTYDAINRKTSLAYPGNSVESFSYDSVSNLKTFTNRNGKVRTYVYDDRNREISSSWNDNSTPSISRTYDGAGRLLTMASNVSTLTFGYDSANKLISEKQNVKGNSAKTISYKPNADGLPGTMTYPDGTVISYDYTGRNQLASVSVNGASPLVMYMYDLAGNRGSKVLENGTATIYKWDDVNRDTLLDNQNSSGSFAKFVYGYDNMDRRTFVKRDDARGDKYFYDAIDQLDSVAYNVKKPGSKKATDPDRTVDYNYDGLGNRLTVMDNGAETAYKVNNLNEYTMVGLNSLKYTNDGALKSYNGWTYTYDAQDRLTKATNGTTTVTFKYDPENRCADRTINGKETFFYYDNWNLIDERDANNTKLAIYINGPMTDEILSKTSSGTTVYFHNDALGNVVKLTGKGGGIVEQYSYDVFGEPTIKDGNGNIITTSAYGNRFMFTGREFIQEVILYDFRNRMYSAELGRFLQTDPLRFEARDNNLYRYVGNDVLSVKDNFGLVRWTKFWSGLGHVVAYSATLVALGAAEVGSGGLATAGVVVGGLSAGAGLTQGLVEFASSFQDNASPETDKFIKDMPTSLAGVGGLLYESTGLPYGKEVGTGLELAEAFSGFGSSAIEASEKLNFETIAELAHSNIELWETISEQNEKFENDKEEPGDAEPFVDFPPIPPLPDFSQSCKLKY